MNDFDLPGYGDMCLCRSYYGCSCPPEPDGTGHLDTSYQAGYDDCQQDGYSERPGMEWVYATHHRARWCTDEQRLVYAMTELRYAEFTWRHRHPSAAAYGRWFEQSYGHDLAEYVAGYDDAGAGLPSAVGDPERHRLFAEALDAYEPEPVLYDRPIGPMPAPTEVDDELPF